MIAGHPFLRQRAWEPVRNKNKDKKGENENV